MRPTKFHMILLRLRCELVQESPKLTFLSYYFSHKSVLKAYSYWMNDI